MTDIVNNGTMSVDEVVASDVPQRYLFFLKRKRIVRWDVLRKKSVECLGLKDGKQKAGMA